MGISVTDKTDQKPDPGPTDGRSSAASAAQNTAADETLYLAGWEVCPRQNRLVKTGHEIILEPKVMDVLLCLAAARGETVSRDDLLNAVWPDTHVSDDSLHRAISLLRRSLSVDPAFEGCIVTVPKRGYRLSTGMLRAMPEPRAAAPAAAAGFRWRSRFGELARRPYAAGLGGGALLALGALAWMISSAHEDGRGATGVRSYPFTGFAGQERAASFAPDGNSAAFSWAGKNGGNWDIYVKTVSGWEPKRLTTDPGADFNAAWSPDGSRISFVRVSKPDGCRIMLMGSGGGSERVLRACSANGDVDLSWSPDSRILYFSDHVGRGGPLAIHALDLDTHTERQVTFPPTDYWGDGLVRVSPDGELLAFARTRALGVTDVFVAPLDGGPATQVTDDRLKVHGIAWNHSGTELYFSSNRGGTFGLWRVGVAGGTPQAVTVGGVNADSVAVSPDGRRLIYETETTSSRLWAVALPGTGDAPPTSLGHASGWVWHPQISPDGARVAFISDRAGSPELWLSNIDGTAPRRLTDFGGAYTNSPAWSPDGAAVLVAAPVAGNFDIYRVDAATGEVERMTRHPAVDRSPSWSLDGKTIFFGSNRTGHWEIWAHETSSRTTRQVTINGGFRAVETSGGQLLFVKRETPGLFSLDLTANEPKDRLLTDRLLPLDCSNWQPAGDKVFMIVRDAEINPRLASLDLATGKLSVLRPLGSVPHYSGLAVAPDHSRVLFTRAETVEADLMIVEGLSFQ